MIIWLSSYPKSGNTYVRSLLSAYYFTKDGNFNFDCLKSIRQFPSEILFKKIGLFTKDANKNLKNYLNAQEYINKKASLIFLKTHSSFFNIKNYSFSDLANTLGAIYIVRDPRNIVTSFSNHYNISVKESFTAMMSDTKIFKKDATNDLLTYIFSWNYHYNSWKYFKKHNKYLLVRYEDLIINPKDTLIKILEFVYRLHFKKPSINFSKLENAVLTTSFDRLKAMEKKVGFDEKPTNVNTAFFHLGKKNDYKKILEPKIKNKIENYFYSEMKELNYIN